MQISKEHIRIPLLSNSTLHAYIRKQDGNDVAGKADTVVVFSHGFSVDGTESRRIFIQMSDLLAADGVSSILFDYRGSGYSDLAFEDMTFDSECEDLEAVLKLARAHFPKHRLAVWGVSFGAAVAAQVAAKRSDIAFVMFWCLSAELHRRYSERLGPEIEGGYTYIDKGFMVKKAFLDSLRDIDTYNSIKNIKAPCLLVHGDADKMASVELSRKAHRVSPSNTTLLEIPGGNHGFKLQPDLYRMALESSLKWVAAQRS